MDEVPKRDVGIGAGFPWGIRLPVPQEKCECLTKAEIIQLIEETLAKNKKKRKPSEYNIFIGKCTADGDDMKTCAEKWKTIKNE